MTVDPAEIAVWTRAWAMSRDRPPPAPAFGGWFVHVGLADQQSRYVFPALDGGQLRRLGHAILAPHVLLKLPVQTRAVQDMLGSEWDAVRTGWFMRTELAATDAPLPAGCKLVRQDQARGTTQFGLHAPDGAEMARARLTVIGDHAAIDSVDTDPVFRRRGLATALMAQLSHVARERGARIGLLTATDAGLKVYERLGWTVLAPWTTAQRNGRAEQEGAGE